MNKYAEILARVSQAESKGDLEVVLRWKHSCGDEVIGIHHFGAGFPNLPIYCDRCSSILTDYKELSFDFAVKRVGSEEYEAIPQDERSLLEFEAKYLNPVRVTK
jgi:hypothetical protein